MAKVLGIACCLAPGACKRPAHNGGQPAPHSVAQYPHAIDRFIGLVRRQLSDVDPLQTEQELTCESERIARSLGGAEALARIRTALDTAYPRRSDTVALGMLEQHLAGHSFGAGNHVCDSLIAAANREEPIVPEGQLKP
ncbi:MAG TPA: hypothetical protein VN607_11905 [Gemmatimonadaceae bacterium]|nr:hypothetical protein [Gemmatimonadaceae bacterium]